MKLLYVVFYFFPRLALGIRSTGTPKADRGVPAPALGSRGVPYGGTPA